VEVGQAVIDCICMDEAVLRALGAAKQLQNLTCKAPPGLVLFLKAGPGAHLRNHAYECASPLGRCVWGLASTMTIVTAIVMLWKQWRRQSSFYLFIHKNVSCHALCVGYDATHFKLYVGAQVPLEDRSRADADPTAEGAATEGGELQNVVGNLICWEMPYRMFLTTD
jgi:hypothetical protein